MDNNRQVIGNNTFSIKNHLLSLTNIEFEVVVVTPMYSTKLSISEVYILMSESACNRLRIAESSENVIM